jgi:hypothetical protein
LACACALNSVQLMTAKMIERRCKRIARLRT